MEDIDNKTKQTREEQVAVRARLEQVTLEYQEVLEKTTQKRENIRLQLAKARREHEKAKSDLAHSESKHDKLVRNLGKNRDALVKLTATKSKARDRKAVFTRRLERLQESSDDLERREHDLLAEHRALLGANQAAKEEQNKVETEIALEMANWKAKLEVTEDKMVAAVMGNREMEMESDDMAAKIQRCADQEVKNEHTRERIYADLITTGKERGEIMEELWGLMPRHKETAERLEKIEDKISLVEDQLKTMLNQLDNQSQIQRRLQTTLRDRIDTGRLELVQDKKDAKVKRTETKVTVVATERALRAFRKEMDDLRNTAREKWETVERMKQELVQIAETKISLHDEVEEEMKTLSPDHAKIQEAHLRLERQLERYNWQTRMMTKKLEEVRQTTIVIKRGQAKIEAEVKELDKQFSEVHIERMKKQRFETNIKSKIVEFTERKVKHDAQQDVFLLERQDITMASMTAELEREMEENRELARSYRSLQNEFYLIKESFLDAAFSIVQCELDVKDVKQVRQIQNHMHHEEVTQLRLQDAYHTLQFGLCQQDFLTTSDQVKAVVVTMDGRVNDAVQFVMFGNQPS